LCFPRFDTPSTFARLLGEQAGYWSVRAPGASSFTRRYVDRTMVLETTYRTATGTAVVVDALAMGEGNRGHDLGKDAPHLLLRQVACSRGEVEMELEYVPRPEYGLVHPLLDAVDGGLPRSVGPTFLLLQADVLGGARAGDSPRRDPLGAAQRVQAWAQTQDQIRQAILSEGWSERVNAFTKSFGSDELDASSLMLPLVEFLPADDPRVLSTIDVTEERLTDKRGLVYRYRARDGLDGEEGAFLLCTFWLAQALAMAGRPDRARAVFDEPRRLSTMSDCSRKRSTRSAVSSWATSPRRSATSA
jgi:GH15 family glucan-1,4-alpha-glucosidase